MSVLHLFSYINNIPLSSLRMAVSDFRQNFESMEVCHLSEETLSEPGATQRPWNCTMHHGSWVPHISAGGSPKGGRKRHDATDTHNYEIKMNSVIHNQRRNRLISMCVSYCTYIVCVCALLYIHRVCLIVHTSSVCVQAGSGRTLSFT